jgi:hypothetical protein
VEQRFLAFLASRNRGEQPIGSGEMGNRREVFRMTARNASPSRMIFSNARRASVRFRLARRAWRPAQNTIPVKVDGIPGDCPTLNWTFDASQPAAPAGAGGSGSGRAQITALAVNRQVDQCSPQLFQLVLSGQHVPSVVMTQYDSTGRIPVLIVTLRSGQQLPRRWQYRKSAAGRIGRFQFRQHQVRIPRSRR